MINAQRTGAYISQLRKAKDWTQLELAEKLHVTHQAVSQWEKGASFPDVALLPQLARLLGVSVDALLNGEPATSARRITRGAMVEEFAHGNPGEVARMVQSDPDGLDLMLETAPLVRPSQVEAVVANLGGYDFTLEQAVGLAPFVSQDVLQSLLARVNAADIDLTVLKKLAPFIGSDHLDRLAGQVASGPIAPEEVSDLAPFLGDAMLKDMVFRSLEAGHPLELEHVESLAPFIDRESLETLIERLPDGPLPLENVVALAPFVGEALLDQLLDRLEDPAEIGSHLHELAPFISRARLTRAVAERQGRLSAQEVLQLAPFLDQTTLDQLIRPGARQ